MSIIRGVLFKYDTDPMDPLMRDNQADAGADICGMMDPDFWTNDVPIWSICGPYVRQGLHEGDMLFFLPKKACIDNTSLSDYICTGVLVVGEILPDSESVFSDPELTVEYKKEYRIDLTNHLKQDSHRTAEIRGKRIIKGDPDRSEWFGRNRYYLKEVFKSIKLGSYGNKLGYQRIPYLENEALSLYSKLLEIHTNVTD